MSYPHCIRLRGPWKAEPLESGRTRYRRGFHKPTGLSDPERVWLVVESSGPGTAAINGRPLGEIAVGQARAFFDLTPHLTPRNEIALELSGSLGDVRLEIRLHSTPEE